MSPDATVIPWPGTTMTFFINILPIVSEPGARAGRRTLGGGVGQISGWVSSATARRREVPVDVRATGEVDLSSRLGDRDPAHGVLHVHLDLLGIGIEGEHPRTVGAVEEAVQAAVVQVGARAPRGRGGRGIGHCAPDLPC